MGHSEEKGGAVPLKPVGLWELVAYFLRLGAFGFGGPIALAGYMQRDLVSCGWITEGEYLEGLAFSQMMPAPLPHNWRCGSDSFATAYLAPPSSGLSSFSRPF